MTYADRVELVNKTVAWLSQADRVVKSVGGYGYEVVLRGISDDLLHTMIANNIQLTTTKVKD